jgi:hypothetical protein
VIARKREEEEENVGSITGATEVQPHPATRRIAGRVEREGNVKGIDRQSLQAKMREK